MPRFSVTAAALVFSLLGCNGEGGLTDPDITSITFAPSLNVDLSQMTKTTQGIYHRDLVTGSGDVVQGSSRIRAHYSGWLPNGTKFDENLAPSVPLNVQLGQGALIAGWEIGIPGMKVGGTRQLVIPPSMGYGAAGRGPIPPNSYLVFVVEMVSIQ